MQALQHRASGSLFSSPPAHSPFGYPISPPSESQDSFDGGSVGGHGQKTTTTITGHQSTTKTSRRPTIEPASKRRRGTTMPDVGHGSEGRGTSSGATEAASDEISVRRERGKLAQRAFRQRQIDMIRILKDENAKLKEAILTISTAAYRSQRELKDAIAEACRIAELNPSGSTREGSSPQHGEDDLEHGSVATQSPRPSSAQPMGSSYPQMGNHHHGGSSAWPTPLELRSSHVDTTQPGLAGAIYGGFDPAHNHGYVNSHTDMFAAPPMTQMNTMPIHELRSAHNSNFSGVYSQGYTDSLPREKSPEILQYEPSIQPYMPSRGSPTRAEHGSNASFPSQPPDDIIPYLGPRAYTIAGQVYWATMGYTWQVLRSLDTTYRAPTSDTIAAVYHLFHIDVTNPQSIAVVKDHLYRRLAFRKQRASSYPPSQSQLQHPPGLLRDRSMGSSSSSSTLFDASGLSSSSVTPPTPQHHSAGMMSMESLLSSSTALAGLDASSYITALAVEEQLRHMLGSHNAQDLETALRNGAMMNGGAGSQSSANTTPTPTPPQQYSRASISGPLPGSNSTTAGTNIPGLVPAKQLLHTLARQAIFFADGPRWHAESVASAASMWSME